MIQIDSARCIGCGRCADDCFPGALTRQEKATVLSFPAHCIGCGHCIAVCPNTAITDDHLDMAEATPVHCAVDSSDLLDLMRSRRSCRHYKQAPVPEALWHTLVDASRACPTAKNLQATRYIAVTERIPVLLDAALAALGQVGRQQLSTATAQNELRRAQNFIRWSDLRQRDKSFDPLFFHAPLLLLFVASRDTAPDAAAGAAYAELMAASLGLGCLYSGYFTACAANSAEIKAILGLHPNEQVVRSLVLGFPDIKFFRTAPRKTPNISML